jgi:hypothetical protein
MLALYRLPRHTTFGVGLSFPSRDVVALLADDHSLRCAVSRTAAAYHYPCACIYCLHDDSKVSTIYKADEEVKSDGALR